MKVKITILISFFVLAINMKAQSDSSAVNRLQEYVNNIQVFNRLLPQEKVYLHFDNTAYTLGETIWFKAYVVTSSNHHATDQSRVLYVELLNAKGKVLKTKKLMIENGQCNGDFLLEPLNAEYFPGFYEIRAYTKGMLNFGDEVVFSRVFPVFEKLKIGEEYTTKDLEENLDISLKNHRGKGQKRKNVNIDFYPEGGNLIEGLTSRMAFRIADENDIPVNDAKIELIDASGKILSSFSPIHKGMGVFSYTPAAGNQIQVLYNNKKYNFDLPKSISQGYVMTIDNLSSDFLIAQIEKSADISHFPLGLSIMSGGNLSFFKVLEMENLLLLEIPKENLSAGVNQITLFDSKGEILSERLFFVFPDENDRIKLKITSDKETYKALEKITIDFSVEGNRDKKSNFSLAVRDENNMAETLNSENIATYLLLSSDLKGFIEDPAYYFQAQDEFRLFALDLLMLVQGWRRYEWQTMAVIKPFKQIYDVEKELQIKGFIHKNKNNPVEVLANMRNEEGYWMADTVRTDKNGIFYLYPEDFYGKWNLTLRSKTIKDAAKNIRLDRWFSPQPKTYSLSETTWNCKPIFPVNTQSIDDWGIRIENDTLNLRYLLETIKVKAKRGKDLVYNVGEDIDYMIDKGEKIPLGVHDYMTNNEHYSYEIWDSKPSEGYHNWRVSHNEYTLEFPQDSFDESNMYQNDNTKRWDRRAYEKNSHIAQKTEITDPDVTNIILRQPKFNTPSNRSPLSDPYIEEGGFFFYKKPTQLVFFHMKDSVWKVNTIQRIKTGPRAFDIAVHQLTWKRIIKEVETIRISGVIKSDRNGTPYTPLLIYPYKYYPMRLLPETRYTTVEGFSQPKEFFVNQTEMLLPSDFEYRRTLYWNPNVELNEQGTAKISFFNNAYTQRINVSAEGLTENGIPIVGE